MSLGQPRFPVPPQQSGVPALPNLWGSLVFMPTAFNTYRTTKFCIVMHIMEGCVLGKTRHCICTNASRGFLTTAELLKLNKLLLTYLLVMFCI